MNQITNIKFAFFGSSRLSVIVLDELEKAGLIPSCVITTPDKPKGRSLTITPNVVKEWAIKKEIPVFDPVKLDGNFIEKLKIENCRFFLVASYGRIIPKVVIEMPAHKTLNIHPSLLPKYRGPSPLPSAMLDDARKTGVTIMRLDEEMDHGPIVAQEEIDLNDHFDEWPTYEDFEEMMARHGARLLAEILPDWIKTDQKDLVKMETKQDHSLATYTKKIIKEDGRLDLTADELKDPLKIPLAKSHEIFRKIQAFHEWPQAYFFIERRDKPTVTPDNKSTNEKIRVKITQAGFDGTLIIDKVIPEGKKEMSYSDFKLGYL